MEIPFKTVTALYSNKGCSDCSRNEKCYQVVFFYDFFLIWTIFKVFIEFVAVLLLFYVVVFWPGGLWDLRSLTRDRTRTPCIGRQSLNHWTAREVPYKVVLIIHLHYIHFEWLFSIQSIHLAVHLSVPFSQHRCIDDLPFARHYDNF